MRRRARVRRGAVIIWSAIGMLAFVGLLGLIIDSGYVYLTLHQLQNVADASALAGARIVANSEEEARAAAIQVASHNFAASKPITLRDNLGNDADGDVVVGWFDRDADQFTPQTSPRNAVRIRARRTNDSPNGSLGLLFGQVFGVNGINLERDAIAMIEVAEGGPGAYILGTENDQGLKISGNGHIVMDGPLKIGSTKSDALDYSGNGSLTADSFDIAGGLKKSGSGEINGTVNTWMETTIADPLASLPEPIPADGILRETSKWDKGDGTYYFQPGRYIGGIVLKDGTYNFAPGVYYIQGGGLDMSGSGTVNMDGVMVYNTGPPSSPNSSLGEFKISGNMTVNWTPIEDEPYQGIAFFQNRNASMSNQSKITISAGQGQMDIQGTIYAPKAPVYISGDAPANYGGLVCWYLEISGNGTFNVGVGMGGGMIGPNILLVR